MNSRKRMKHLKKVQWKDLMLFDQESKFHIKKNIFMHSKILKASCQKDVTGINYNSFCKICSNTDT